MCEKNTRCNSTRFGACARGPTKQGICRIRVQRKCLRMRVRVICCAPNSSPRNIFSAAFFLYEESKDGKERWRTDEVGNRGNDLQGQRAVPQAGRRGVRVTQRHHQEEPAWSWSVHAPRLAQDEGRQEARHEGARRHQPLHEGKDGVQGEAGLQEGPRAAAEEPQGARQLTSAAPSARATRVDAPRNPCVARRTGFLASGP